MQLFDEEESENEEFQPKINIDTEYAKKYDDWRKKELLHKLKAKYGDDPLLGDSDESSSSSDDDEDGVFTNDKFNNDFYKVMAALKSKDPKIYDKNVKFFEDNEENDEEVVKKKKKEKKDELPFDAYTGEVLKKQNIENESDTKKNKQKANIDDDIKKLMEVDSDSDDDPFGSSSKIEKPSKQSAMQHNLLDEKKVLEKLFKKKATSREEQFLYDYIIAEGPKDNIVYDDDDDGHTKNIVDHSDDDLEDALQEEYEHKYNFRFEEPDPEFIKRYPRTIESSMRMKDNKRKDKRAEVKERKAKEKEQKMEEIRQLQALKLNEIEDKISKLKQVTGKNDLALNEEDIDGDFDPEEHDRKMQALFNDEFYKGAEEEYKPEFPELDEELEIENWNKYEGNIENEEENQDDTEPHCEDDNFNMDCDYNAADTQAEIIESTRGKKKRKRKSKFAQVLGQKRPVFDPNDKTYEKYLDEYYKLDCEDIIGDIPCRFKYRKVTPNSFGLSIEEILAANDRELNKWCSIKKTMALRPDNVEKYDVIAYERKGQNVDLKKKILPSLFEENESKNKKSGAETIENTEETKQDIGENTKESKKKKNKRKNKTENNNEKTVESTENRSNVETASKKKKNKKIAKKGVNKNVIENKTNIEISTVESKKSKKKSVPSAENLDQSASTDKPEVTSETIAVSNKKKRKRAKQTNVDKAKVDVVSENMPEETEKPKTGKKRKQSFDNKHDHKKKKLNKKDDSTMGMSDERLKAYGINPKKFKNKLKYKK